MAKYGCGATVTFRDRNMDTARTTTIEIILSVQVSSMS